ncbi:hypothetical protein HYX58_05850 [Candidatus Dependentiae bacterium]|nr:hypothetical protein [Candidatus Dependentiae bacterium]
MEKFRRSESVTAKKTKSINTKRIEEWVSDHIKNDRRDLAALIMTTANNKTSWQELFHETIEKQELVPLEKLLKTYKVDVNKPDINGIAPIFKALEKIALSKKTQSEKEIEIAMAIISSLIKTQEIDFSVKCEGKTPLEFAAFHNLDEAIDHMKEAQGAEQLMVVTEEVKKENGKTIQRNSTSFQRFRSFSLSALKKNEKKK